MLFSTLFFTFLFLQLVSSVCCVLCPLFSKDLFIHFFASLLFVFYYAFLFWSLGRSIQVFGWDAVQPLVDKLSKSDILSVMDFKVFIKNFSFSFILEASSLSWVLGAGVSSFLGFFYFLYVLLFSGGSASVGLDYPEMVDLYRRGRLIVFPDVSASLVSVQANGFLLAITWPYGPYTPQDLLLLGLPLSTLLSLSCEVVDTTNPGVGSCWGAFYIVREAMQEFDAVVTASTHVVGGSLVLDYFTVGMFLGIPLEDLRQLGRWLDYNNLVMLSSLCPSLHPTYLTLGITATEGQLCLQNPRSLEILMGWAPSYSEDLLLSMLSEAPSDLFLDSFMFHRLA